MQITNDSGNDLALTVWDLVPALRLIVQNYPLNRRSVYGVPFLNKDGDGNNRIRWRTQDSDGNVNEGDANSSSTWDVRVG